LTALRPSTRIILPRIGHFKDGLSMTSYELDAVEFCRTLCGRASGDGLLATEVPF